MVANSLIHDARLAEVVRRLIDTYLPERIYLFGSMARGDAGPDSDYDLMMLVEKADESPHRISQKAHSLLWDLGFAADILVWTRRGRAEDYWGNRGR